MSTDDYMDNNTFKSTFIVIADTMKEISLKNTYGLPIVIQFTAFVKDNIADMKSCLDKKPWNFKNNNFHEDTNTKT